jgi:hypothetical protein
VPAREILCWRWNYCAADLNTVPAPVGILTSSALSLVPMQAYKTQLWQLLADHGWEVVEVIAPDDWWADEFWKVQSRRIAWGLEIVLTFLVDPMWEAPRKQGQGVWAVSATTVIPADRLRAESGIGELCTVKGRFDQQLALFISTLDAYRDAQHRGEGNRAEPFATPDRGG